MAEDLTRVLITKAASIMIHHIRDEFNQVVNIEDDHHKLISTLNSIQSTLHDAGNREIEDESVKAWLKDLKFTSYDIDDVLTDWNTATLEVNGNTSRSNLRNNMYLAFVFPCFYSYRMTPLRKIAIQIRNINQNLASIDARKNAFQFAASVPSNQIDAQVVPTERQSENFTTSHADPSKICGRDNEKADLLSKLTGQGGPRILFIWGMGGMGKTTLAQFLFHCDEVQDRFEIKMWVPVGAANSQVTKVAQAIVQQIPTNGSPEFQTPIDHIRGRVDQKRFLLVLDDVWAEEVISWQPLFLALSEGAPGSKIVITAQNEEVGRKINAIIGETFMYNLGVLSDKDSWTIFSKFAFVAKSEEFCEDLQGIGREVRDKCGGLPLALETVGSLMNLKETREEWEYVLNDNIWRSELGDSVLKPLMLSYRDLPSAMQRCFCYCANFPKGIKIDAVNLIQIWMGQGCLGYDGNLEMEITGRSYVNGFVRRSLFQDAERDKDNGTVLRFKIHEMVHNVASYLTENECLMVTGMPKEVGQNRHLTVMLEDNTSFPSPPEQSEKLYTFSIQSYHDCPQIVNQNCVTLPPNFFKHFKYLKTLDMSRNMLRMIPDDVDKLKNLCHLNLSHNPFYELPETVCSLPNLQTLKLIACYHLTKLPQSICKLKKLRHLEIDETRSLATLPKGVAKLTSLRTLSRFLIGNNDASCSLVDLRNLNHLRGRLKIEGLNEMDASKAEEAELEKKEHVYDLNINCSSASTVIDGLKLNSNLGVLRIDKYGGHGFPNWMADLTNLKKVRLHSWANCVGLPPLGKLQLLKVLHIEGFKAITHVGSEFLGVGTVENVPSASSSSSSSSSNTAFPKLEKLKFSDMAIWEEWNMNLMTTIKIMPCIRYLSLSKCNKLQSLPEEVLCLPIKKLRISRCAFLKQRYQNEKGDKMKMVLHISHVRIH